MTFEEIIHKLPLASFVFLIYAIVGLVMLTQGTLEYGSYSDNLMAIGIACGVLGVPRALTKVVKNQGSVNFLGFIESIPIPSVVFIIFVAASTISLSTGAIEFGAFSDNVMKLGIACGAIQAARTAEHVFGSEATV